MFNLANLCTAANLLSGCFAILLALTGHVYMAPFALFAAMVFDFLDGFAARLLKTSGELGKQLDSLADMVSFGVAPGMIMMVFIVGIMPNAGGDFAPDFSVWLDSAIRLNSGVSYLPFIALVFPFFALFRLAKFNIDTRQSHSFIGLPTPAATLFFMSFPLAAHFDAAGDRVETVLMHPFVVVFLVLMISVMMVMPLPLFALKFKQYGWKGNEIRYLFLLISLGLIPLAGAWSFALIVFLYLLFSIVQNIFLNKSQHEIQSGN